MQYPDLLLQHPSKTLATYISETSETYACNMRFQRNITLLLGRMELIVVELDDGANRGWWRHIELVDVPAEWRALRGRAPPTRGCEHP